MLAECNLSPENSPAVFVCLKRKFDESKMKSLKDPKEIFISGMMLMNTSASCFKNATSEQKRCLLNKKNEMQEKISETSEKFQKVMDGILLSCGVSKNNTPDLVECIQPKRESLMKLIPDLLNDPATAEPVWDLMEEAKKCFESKPEIGKCLKQKNMAYFMAKFGKKKDFVPRMEIMGKVKMMLKKCNISVESTPNVYACMQTKVDNLKDLMRSKDMSPAEKMVEFSKMRKEGLKCLENDEKRQKCVEETSRSFIKVVAQKFRMPPGGFDVNTVMKRMDGMLAGCGITSEKTPQLKSCLDERTDAVMKIKPWLPMDNEAREKLKAEGVKYWKCFGDGQGEELQCMKKIVDGFKTQGKAFAERMKKISGSVDKKINDLLQNVTNEVLVCSPNKCFEKNVKAAFEESKDYWKFMKASKKEEVERLKKNIANSLVQGMFCLQNLPTFEQAKTFTCLQPIINKTSLVVNEMIQKWNKGNSKRWDKSWGVKEGKAEELQRKKRDTEEEEQEDEEKEETGFLFVSFLNYPPQSTDDSSVDAFQSLLDKQSVERIQAFFNLMKNFLSKCTSWGPPPQDMTDSRSSRQIIDHGGLPARPPPPSDMMDKFVPPAQIGEDYGRCKLMYESIKSFVNNGKMMGGQQQPKEIHHHLSTSVIVAACIGSVIVVVLILLTIMVIFVTRRSCNSHNHQSSPASAPQEPSTTVSFPPKETPPSYNEIHDKGNCATDAVYSQVLDTSTRGGTEKSC